MSGKDLNLLRVFVVIAEERNLSRAGERLSLSQPALSHALKRLRGELGDPLFVRASRGLVPTPYAERMVPRIRSALSEVDALYASQEESNLASLERRFVLGATTYFELRVLQPLMRQIARVAPGVVLETRPLIEGFPARELEDGRMDLAVAAYFADLPQGFRVRALGADPHVCVMRKGHPLAGSRLTLPKYLEAAHVKIDVPPGKTSAVDAVLAKAGESRKLSAYLSNFMMPPLVVKDGDYLLTCPQSLAESYSKLFGLTWTKLPIAVPPIEVKMAWHERNHSDPLQRWMRERIVEAAKG